MLYESATGYLCDFIIYTGTETLHTNAIWKFQKYIKNGFVAIHRIL